MSNQRKPDLSDRRRVNGTIYLVKDLVSGALKKLDEPPIVMLEEVSEERSLMFRVYNRLIDETSLWEERTLREYEI